MSGIKILSVLIAFIVFSQPVFANVDVYKFTSEENRLEYLALTKELRCPKCQNQDIADSNAPIAADMRREVHRLLEKGKSQEQVVEFMVERFGDFVTYKPKLSAETFMLWYGPWIFIAFGVVIIGFVLKKKATFSRQSNEQSEITGCSDQESLSSSDKVQALLKEYDAGNDQDKS